MKKFLASATTLALLVPSLALAAYNDVTLTTDTVLSVNSSDITVEGTSAVVASAEVGATTVVFSMPAGSRIELRSASGTAMTASDTSIVTVNTCSSNSRLSLNNTGDSTITETVTVGSGACTASGGNGGGGGSSYGGGSGGGGGAPSTTYTTTAQGTQTTTQTSTTASTGGNVAALVAQLQSLIQLYVSLGGTVTPQMQMLVSGSMSTSASGSFTRDLQVGSTGNDVKALQVWLNGHGYVIAQTGPGSPGNETTMFGGATKAALMKFQQAKGISPASGYFGPKTRAALSGM